MATESNADEEKPLTALTATVENETSELTLMDQFVEQFSNLLEDLLPKVEEEPEGPPLFRSFDLASAAAYMAKCFNILVMSGAGISTSVGIPDFRTPGTGLYSQLEKYNLPNPEAIFTLDYFRENPEPFFRLSKELYPKKFTPSPTHYFIRLLNEKGKLLRTFTQNVDCLERIAGIPAKKIVEAHGTFATSHCLECRKEYSMEYVQEIICKDEIPRCVVCKGLIKPDVIFFGERLPPRFEEYVQSDFPKCDFLIIVGTSLAVAPFNNLISLVDKNCPRLLINIEPVGNVSSFWIPSTGTLRFDSPKNRRDIFHQSTCDDGVSKLAKLLGWENDFQKLLQKERISSTPGTVSSNVTVASTSRTSSVPKPVNGTARRRTISPTKARNANGASSRTISSKSTSSKSETAKKTNRK